MPTGDDLSYPGWEEVMSLPPVPPMKNRGYGAGLETNWKPVYANQGWSDMSHSSQHVTGVPFGKARQTRI